MHKFCRVQQVERSHMEIDASPGQPRSCGTPYPPAYRTQTRSAPSRQHLKLICSVNVILVKYLLASLLNFLNHVNVFFYLLCLLLCRRLRTCYMMRAPINTNMVYDDDDDDDSNDYTSSKYVVKPGMAWLIDRWSSRHPIIMIIYKVDITMPY